jgi:hypothetical protein
LSQFGVPHTQNFEIPLKSQESKKIEISFESFQKMLDGSKFGKRCLLGISIRFFFRFGKYRIFFKKFLIFLKKGQNFVRLGTSLRDEILHEHALLG